MPREYQEPYIIERGIGNSVAVQSSVQYSAVLILPLKVKKNGRMNVIEPFALERGMKIVLSAAQHSDVVINGGGGDAA